MIKTLCFNVLVQLSSLSKWVPVWPHAFALCMLSLMPDSQWGNKASLLISGLAALVYTVLMKSLARWRWVLEFQCQSGVCVLQGEIRWLILPQHRGALIVLRLTASLILPFCLTTRLVPAADSACGGTWRPSDWSALRCRAWRWEWACLQHQERSFPWSL